MMLEMQLRDGGCHGYQKIINNNGDMSNNNKHIPSGNLT